MWKHLLCPLARGARVLMTRTIQNHPTLTRTVLLMSTMHMVNIEDEHNVPLVPPVDPDDLNLSDFAKDFQMACVKNDEAILELIKTLNMCISEICEQYQDCVAKQIEIILLCMNLNPLGKQWDDLTRYRVEANELKLEFEKYGMLVERIGSIIYHQLQHTEIISDSCNNCNSVHGEYETLKFLIRQKGEENHYWDSKLLDVNRRSILNGVK